MKNLIIRWFRCRHRRWILDWPFRPQKKRWEVVDGKLRWIAWSVSFRCVHCDKRLEFVGDLEDCARMTLNKPHDAASDLAIEIQKLVLLDRSRL